MPSVPRDKMVEMKKRALTYISVAIVVGIVVVVAWIRLVPGNIINRLIKTGSPVGRLICAFPVKIGGNSMEPALKEGAQAIFNKCVDAGKKLPVGTIVLFEDSGRRRIGRIREVLDNDLELRYKIAQDARPLDLIEVLPQNIAATYGE